jgi:CRP-like cAMP-binding protein
MANDLSSFAPDLWSALETVRVTRSYEDGTLLFAQGETVEGVYMIQRGRVQVWMPERVRGDSLTATAESATMLGLSETIAGGTHKLSAQALVRIEVGFVAREPLMEFLRGHHDICLPVVRMLSEDLHGLYHRFQGLEVVSPRQRRFDPDRNAQ